LRPAGPVGVAHGHRRRRVRRRAGTAGQSARSVDRVRQPRPRGVHRARPARHRPRRQPSRVVRWGYPPVSRRAARAGRRTGSDRPPGAALPIGRTRGRRGRVEAHVDAAGTGATATRVALVGLRSGTRATFASMRVRNFRLFFVGQLISQVGNWLTLIAQTLLVLKLTDNGVALGALAAAQFGPVLILGPWAGLVADRSDKRRLLL